jgi:tRNA(adenine34) deaminase
MGRQKSMDYHHFMNAALDEARKALAADEFPVGCVLVCDNQIVATGSRIGTTGGGKNEIDHAEMVAIREMTSRYPVAAPSNLTAFSTMEPCLMCLGALLINQVTEIVYAYEDVMGGATGCRLSELGQLYRNIDLKVKARVMRSESLELFKSFFAKPGNEYWKGSLLAQYTLRQ